MSILNKKGQDVSINWIVGALSGILIGSIILSLTVQWYFTRQQAEESFDTLVAQIEKMNAGDKSSMAYYLPDEYLLVSFTGGNKFDTDRYDLPGRSYVSDESCHGTVDIPPICGNAPCLCVCRGSYKYGYEKACVKKAVACYPFTSENTKDLNFYDSDCGTGVYREGPGNGIFSLFLEKENNIIKFCSVEGCVTEEQDKAVDATKLLVDAYESCAEKREDCSCALDFSFFQENPYALSFKGTSLTLLDLSKNQEIYTTTLSLPATTSISGFSQGLYLYAQDTTYQPYDLEVSEVGYTTSSTLVISPSKETINIQGTTTSETEKLIAETLYKETSAMEFKTSTYDFSNVKSCTELETSSSQEVKIA